MSQLPLSLRRIFAMNDQLQGQLSLWNVMSDNERSYFIEMARWLVFEARECEGLAQSKSTKTRLGSIITRWSKFLNDLNKALPHELAIITKSSKISPSPAENRADEVSMAEFIRSIWYHIVRPISQPLSKSKVTSNSPLPTPHNPKSRAIFDELYRITDSTGNSE